MTDLNLHDFICFLCHHRYVIPSKTFCLCRYLVNVKQTHSLLEWHLHVISVAVLVSVPPSVHLCLCTQRWSLARPSISTQQGTHCTTRCSWYRKKMKHLHSNGQFILSCNSWEKKKWVPCKRWLLHISLSWRRWWSSSSCNQLAGWWKFIMRAQRKMVSWCNLITSQLMLICQGGRAKLTGFFSRLYLGKVD